MGKPSSAQTTPKTGSEIALWVEAHKKEPWHMMLKTRMEDEYKWYYALDQKPIPSDQGTWDKVVINSPKVFAKKLIRKQSKARLKFTIPIYHEIEEAEQERVSMTEQAVYGLLSMADDLRTSRPGGIRTQAVMADHTNTTGFIIPVFMLSEDDDDDDGDNHGEKVVQAHLFVWKFIDTYWEEGGDSLKAICNIRWEPVAAVNDRYGLELPDQDEPIEIHHFIDREWEQVEIGGKVVNYDGKGNRHGLGRVPARIFMAGSAEMPSNASFVKYAGESCWADSGDMWQAQSKMASYRMTNIKRQISNPTKVKYNSQLGGPPETKNDPSAPGTATFLDTSKEQDVEPLLTPAMSVDAAQMDASLKQNADRGSATDLSYGEQRGDVTAQGTAMLLDASNDNLTEGTLNIEQALTWWANESVRQYKFYGFKDTKIQGVDGKNKQFATSIDPKKLITDRKIEAHLDLSAPRDEMENVGKAVELWKMPEQKVSDLYIKDKILKMDDPTGDDEQLIIEKVEALTGVPLIRSQAIAIKKKDRLLASVIGKVVKAAQERWLAMMSPEVPPQIPGQGGGNGGGVPGAEPPAAMPGQMMKGNMPSNRMNQARRTMQGRQ